MDREIADGEQRYSTGRLASATGYSVQQIRDLERLQVIPPASRRPNGYRQFDRTHRTALRAYRNLAVAVGPVAARATLRDIRALPYDEAVATIVALHVDLARTRDETVNALGALDLIVDENVRDAAPAPEDSMTITELSRAIGVRSSALRFWERQCLIAPDRRSDSRVRSYPPRAVNDARIVAALRAGGYRIPEVRVIMTSLNTSQGSTDARATLHSRLRSIASRSDALLRAGADIADQLPRQ